MVDDDYDREELLVTSPRGFKAAKGRAGADLTVLKRHADYYYDDNDRNDFDRFSSSSSSSSKKKKMMMMMMMFVLGVLCLFVSLTLLVYDYSRKKGKKERDRDDRDNENKKISENNELDLINKTNEDDLERAEERERGFKDEEITTMTKTTRIEEIEIIEDKMKTMTVEELKVFELSVKMRAVLSKEKSNELRERALALERNMLEAKLASLDLRKDSNVIMEESNDLMKEKIEYARKMNSEKVFREDVADALRFGLIVLFLLVIYNGWNVIQEMWRNESEICFQNDDRNNNNDNKRISSSSSSRREFMSSVNPILLITRRVEKLWCRSKTTFKAIVAAISSMLCSKFIVKFGLLSGQSPTLSPLTSIAATLGIGGSFIGYNLVRFLNGEQNVFLSLWIAYLSTVMTVNENANAFAAKFLKSFIRRASFRFVIGIALPVVIASAPFHQ